MLNFRLSLINSHAVGMDNPSRISWILFSVINCLKNGLITLIVYFKFMEIMFNIKVGFLRGSLLQILEKNTKTAVELLKIWNLDSVEVNKSYITLRSCIWWFNPNYR